MLEKSELRLYYMLNKFLVIPRTFFGFNIFKVYDINACSTYQAVQVFLIMIVFLFG